MDLTWHEFLGLAVSSGAAAGLANQVFKFLHDLIADKRAARARTQELAHQQFIQQRDLEHQTTTQQRDLAHRLELQREERLHQAEVRREVDFYEARKTYLPKLVAVRSWIQWWWGDLYGADVDYHPITHRPKVVQSAGEALTVLEEIAGNHPSKSVRVHATKLYDNIDSAVNFPDPAGHRDPTVDELSNWSNRAGELIDALHDPQHEFGPH